MARRVYKKGRTSTRARGGKGPRTRRSPSPKKPWPLTPIPEDVKHLIPLVAWWEHTRRNPEYRRIYEAAQRGGRGKTRFSPNVSERLASLGYYRIDVMNPEVSADAMLCAQGLPRVIDPEDTSFETSHVLGEIRPPWMFLPVDLDTPLLSKAASITNAIAGAPLHIDGRKIDEGGSGDVIDLSRIPSSRWQDAHDGEVARQAVSGYVAVAVPVWLPEPSFRRAMSDLFARVIDGLSRTVYNPRKLNRRIACLRVLGKIERLYSMPSKEAHSRENYVDRIEDVARRRRTYILRWMPGPTSERAKLESFRETVRQCGLLNEWPYHYSKHQIREVRDKRLSDDYWEGDLDEGKIRHMLSGPGGYATMPLV